MQVDSDIQRLAASKGVPKVQVISQMWKNNDEKGIAYLLNIDKTIDI